MIRSISENRISSTIKLKLDDFKVWSHIGQGSYGTVKLVMHKLSGKKYALKILNKFFFEKNNKKHHIKIENAILNYLKVDKVIELVETFKDETNIYFLLEYLPKGDFCRFWKVHNILLENHVKFYVLEIWNILIYLHSLGIIHRDLKPSNWMLTNNNQLKIIDFGAAKIIPNENNKDLILLIKSCFNNLEDNKNTKWRRISLSGTFNYVSPEVLKNEGYSIASDYWALGIITHKMLTGKIPIEKLTDDNDYIIKIENNLKEEAKDFISKLLINDPEKRLTNIKEITNHPFIFNFKGLNPNTLNFNNKINIIIENETIFEGKFRIQFLLLFKKLRIIKLDNRGVLKIIKISNNKIYDKFIINKDTKVNIKNYQIIIKNKEKNLKIEPEDGNYIKYYNLLKNWISNF